MKTEGPLDLKALTTEELLRLLKKVTTEVEERLHTLEQGRRKESDPNLRAAPVQELPARSSRG